MNEVAASSSLHAGASAVPSPSADTRLAGARRARQRPGGCHVGGVGFGVVVVFGSCRNPDHVTNGRDRPRSALLCTRIGGSSRSAVGHLSHRASAVCSQAALVLTAEEARSGHAERHSAAQAPPRVPVGNV